MFSSPLWVNNLHSVVKSSSVGSFSFNNGLDKKVILENCRLFGVWSCLGPTRHLKRHPMLLTSDVFGLALLM
jgi:hypothetical protein